jgi:hypothetical protein
MAGFYRSIFPLPEDLVAVIVAYEFKAGIDQRACFLLGPGHSRDVFLFAFEELFGQMNVD